MLSTKQQTVIALLLGALLFAGGVRYGIYRAQQKAVETAALIPPSSPPEAAPSEIFVHVAGEVANPGLYRLPTGARVADALEKARPLSAADLDAVNLAAPLMDGQKITVPRQGAPGQTAGVSRVPPLALGEQASPGQAININTATAKELEELPGIGPTLAGRIVSYREQKGPFRTKEDIMNVSGIGEGRFSQIKDLITVY